MDVILDYRSKTELKERIIQQYIEGLHDHIRGCEYILADKNFANSDSDYDKDHQDDFKKSISEAESQIKLLTE